MVALWSFQWQLTSANPETDTWHPKAKAWKSSTGAGAAAMRWVKDMADEDCKVRARLVELVDDGRHGRFARATGTTYGD